jgi:hypothetical protein
VITTEVLCFGGALLGVPLTLWLAGKHWIRYVRIESLATETPLHLDEVEVWVRRSFEPTRHLSGLTGGNLILGSREMKMFPQAGGYELHNADDDATMAAADVRAIGIEALVLRRGGRFGNQVIQLLNALQVACVTGARTLFIDNVNPLGLEGTVKIGELTFSADAWKGGPEKVLEGSFFYREDLGDLLRSITSERLRLVRTYLDPLFAPVLDRIGPQDPSTLHVHIRSGDLFSGSNVHPGYPQPPLTYYQTCIEHARLRSAVESVVVVNEDDANPTVGALAAWLDSKGIRYRTQSGTFSEDLAELLSARTMVASFGTFCDAIGLLSRNIQHYYSFRTTRYWAEMLAKGATFGQVVDSDEGPYIAVGSWQNTEAQRQEMLTYPARSLRLRELG